MGMIMQIRCETCGHRDEFLTGGGMNDCHLRTILSALDETMQKRLAEDINHGAKYVTITRELRACPSCAAVQALPVVTYTINGTAKTLFGICSHCGRSGDEHWPSEKDLRCPGCGAALTVQQTGNWD